MKRARDQSDSHAKIERMLGEVRAAGLKLTPQRLAIVRELAADPTHPTAQELYERLSPALPTMSFATVYNTLASLSAAGLCAARSLGRGPARFDPNTGEHDHAVCDGCGGVMDVPVARSDAAPPLEGFKVRAVERVYRGLCRDCARGD
jgi:Fur family peroxide stress response transcriptional regulator